MLQQMGGLLPAIITNHSVSSTELFRQVLDCFVKTACWRRLYVQVEYIPTIFEFMVADEGQIGM